MTLVEAGLIGAALIGGTLGAVAVWTGIRFARRPRAFRCRLGTGRMTRLRWRRWQLRRTRARWVEDVLLIRSGLLGLGVTAAWLAQDAVVRSLPSGVVHGLGKHPVVVRMTLEDGRTTDVAAPDGSRMLLVGPFLAAAVHGLPAAPHEREI